MLLGEGEGSLEVWQNGRSLRKKKKKTFTENIPEFEGRDCGSAP